MKKKYQKCFSFVMIAMLLLGLLAGCGAKTESEQSYIESIEQLNNGEYKVGVPQGAAAMYAGEEVFTEADLVYYSSVSEGYTAVEYGKVDAFVFDKHALEYASGNNDALCILPNSKLAEEEIVIGMPFGSDELMESVNEFIALCNEDGTMDEMYARWILGTNPEMPEIATPENPTMKLLAGTDGTNEPMNFYGENKELMGYDIEFIKRLAVYLNADIEIVATTFDSLMASTASGQMDLMAANLNNTEAVREEFMVSDGYITTEIAVLVNKDNVAESGRITSIDEISDCTVGVVTGSIYDQLSLETFPNIEVAYLNTVADLPQSLMGGQVDCIVLDQPMIRFMSNEEPAIYMVEELLDTADYAYGFQLTEEGDYLRNQMDEFLTQIKADGTLAEIDEKWFGTDESKKTIDYSGMTGENGTLRLAVDATAQPFSYVANGEVVGYDVDLAAMFCIAYGYQLEVDSMDFGAIITSLCSGAYELAAGCITVTEERKESIYFSVPNYEGGVAVAFYDDTYLEEDGGFLESIKDSFDKTFIKEERWKLFAEGIGITVLISVVSAIIGTILGFGVCLMRRSAYKIPRGIAKGYIRLLQGTPTVVLLMILYYIVFQNIGMDAVVVAMIGFGLNFAAYVSEMIRTGIDAVDGGQVEAAKAIGFTKVQTFTKIVLPQAARHFLPVYKGEFIAMVKMTSIVGYIAIQDLTKMSDIVRSRTYEAFFPLIATAVIYFILSYILTVVLDLIQIKLDPKKGKRVVKGVKTK